MKNNEYPIIIHYVGEKDDPSAFAHAHTHGMEFYGMPNLCIPYYVEPEKASEVLNTVSEWMIEEGYDFPADKVHACDDEEGNNLWCVKFGLIRCCGDLCVQVDILDENGEAPTAWKEHLHEDLELLTAEDVLEMFLRWNCSGKPRVLEMFCDLNGPVC